MKYIYALIIIFFAYCFTVEAAEKPIGNYYIKFADKSISKIKESVKKLSTESGMQLRPVIPMLRESGNVTNSEINSLRRIFTIKNASEADIQHIINNYKFEYIEEIPELKLFERPDDLLISQQYYLDSMDIYNVWDLIDMKQDVVIGVVDTGVELNHPDLAKQIWRNPGETGLDGNGNSKADNGIDDDNNGYVDDWTGWDFYANAGAGDNNPNPGKDHGTHVAGIVAAATNNQMGIAGVAPHAKIMAVKAAPDDPSARAIVNAYQGILYAAMMGADVINCSFGGGGYSQAEAEIIETAQKYGALIVAAAGNDYAYSGQYPASYPGVLSVASLTYSGYKSSFSNYGPDVDICAFGSNIFSTITGFQYASKSGTSMASPVVAGVAALVKSNYPDISNEELAARLIATAVETNQLAGYKGMLGMGQMNPMQAITENNPRMIDITNLETEYRYDPLIKDAVDTVYINFELKNIFSEVENVKAYYYVRNSEYNAIIEQIDIGTLKSKESFESSYELAFTLPETLGNDFNIEINFVVEAEDNYSQTKSIRSVVNPSYLDMDMNNITCTFNSEGNIGFNDYSTNVQGKGCRFHGYNFLFEGAIIAGTRDEYISNNARGSSGSARNRDFKPINFIEKYYKQSNLMYAATSYTDSNSSMNTNIIVDQEVYQSRAKGMEDILLVNYKIKNLDYSENKELYFGQFFDWDISLSGQHDLMQYDIENDFAFAKDLENDELPAVYIKILSNYNKNFYAINNDGSNESFSIYDGFKESEKWLAISSGLKRLTAVGNDGSMVLSAGPIDILPLDTADLTFAITFAFDKEEAVAKFEKSKELIEYIENIHLSDELITDINVFPNPTSDNIQIYVTLLRSSPVSVNIYDASGKIIANLANKKLLSSGVHSFDFSAKELAQGTYYIELRAKGNSSTKGFVVIK